MPGEENYIAVSMREAFTYQPAAWPNNIALFVHNAPLQQDVAR